MNQKEVKEVCTVAERLVTESSIPAEFPEETGVLIPLTGVVSIIAAPYGRLVYLFVEIGGNIIGFVQVVGILAFGFSALLMIWSVLLIITSFYIAVSKTSAGRTVCAAGHRQLSLSCYAKKTAVI